MLTGASGRVESGTSAHGSTVSVELEVDAIDRDAIAV